MGVDVHHAQGSTLAQCLEYRVGDRMIPADRQGTHALRLQSQVVLLDVLERLFETVAAAKRHIADCGGGNPRLGPPAKRRVNRPNALHRAYRTRPETRPAAIGNTK